jgi:hypothetical protein
MTSLRNVIRRMTCVIAYGFAVTLAWSQQPAGEPKIVVIEGDDGANILKGKVAVKPVVEVRDQWNIPIAGARVTFDLPSGKPGVTFVNGKEDASVITDINGRATTGVLKPIGKGQFKIGIRAFYHGDVASATIRQTNYGTAAAAAGAVKIPGPYANAMSGTTKALIVVALAAGAAAGVAAAVGSKNSTSSGSNCASQYNAFTSDLNTAVALSVGSTQWIAASQNMFSALGSYCSCAGGAGELGSNSTLLQDVRNLVSLGRQDGFAVPSSCGF